MSDDTEGVMFTMGDARRIDRSVTYFEHHVLGTPTPRPRNGSPQVNDFPYRYAQSLVIIAAGSLTSPSSFTANIWVPDLTSTATPKPYIVATDTILLGITVANRMSWTTTTSGVICMIEYMFGGWELIQLNCP